MVLLTLEQKQALVNYILGDLSKGPFEDLEIFQTDEVESHFSEYRVAGEKFVELLREKILTEFNLREIG